MPQRLRNLHPRCLAIQIAGTPKARKVGGPIVLRQMKQIVEQAEVAGTDEAKVVACGSLKQIVSWLRAGADE